MATASHPLTEQQAVSADEIKAAAKGRWPEILTDVAGIPADLLDARREHPCPQCGGTTRFRLINADQGAVYCSHCFDKKNGDGLAAVQWMLGCTFPEAISLIGSYLGITASDERPVCVSDPISMIERAKGIPAGWLKHYGARAVDERYVDLPMYDPQGKECSYCRLDAQRPSSKGLNAKGEPVGLYLPHDDAGNPRLPAAGEKWEIVEGPKDAAKLASMGYLAIGLPGSSLPVKFGRLMRGVDVNLIPDRDQGGESGAKKSAANLHGHATSIGIVVLPAPFSNTGGADCRDVCRMPNGEALLREAIADAQPWVPGCDSGLEPDDIEGDEPAEEVLAWKPPPTEVLPTVVRDLVREGADTIGCDESMIMLPCLAALASSIGTTRRLALRPDWHAVAIFWGLIGAESGGQKTPSHQTAMDPLNEIQRVEFERYTEARKLHDEQTAVHERDMADWRKAKDGSPPPPKPDEPIARRYVVQDTTVEALAVRLRDNPRGLLLARDELSGWFGSFDRYAASKGADSAHWLSMYNGHPMVVDRKSGDDKTIYVPHASVSVVGGIQPGVFARMMTQQLRESGMLARMLLAFPPPKMRGWPDGEIRDATKQRYADVIKSLHELEPDYDDQGRPSPRVLTMAPDAKSAFIEFYLENNRERLEMSGDLAAAWSKLEEYPGRLALVLHLTRWASGEPVNPDVVDLVSMRSAITLTRWFGREVRRVYGMLDESPGDADQRRLMEFVARKGGSVTAREVYTGCRWLPERTSEAAEAALQRLVAKGLGQWEMIRPTGRGGRPTRRFVSVSTVSVHETPENPANAEVTLTRPAESELAAGEVVL